MLRNLTRTCYRFVHLTCQMQTKKSKSHFSTLLFIHFRLLTLPQKKTNSNCSFAVYLLWFGASYLSAQPYYRVWGTLQEERMCGVPVRDMDELLQRLVATWAEFQQSVVYDAIDQWQRLGACIDVERCHFEHLLWHCLPDIPVATDHNRFFSETQTFERTQQTFSRRKGFAFHELVWWHFKWGGFQFVFFWDNVNNQK